MGLLESKALIDRASKVVALAKRGSRQTDWRRYQTTSMLAASTNARDAYARAAYWMAVAARYMGSKNLGSAASKQLSKARELWPSGSPQRILASAAGTIAAYAKQRRQDGLRGITAIRSILASGRTSADVASERTRKAERRWVRAGAKGYVSTVAEYSPPGLVHKALTKTPLKFTPAGYAAGKLTGGGGGEDDPDKDPEAGNVGFWEDFWAALFPEPDTRKRNAYITSGLAALGGTFLILGMVRGPRRRRSFPRSPPPPSRDYYRPPRDTHHY